MADAVIIPSGTRQWSIYARPGETQIGVLVMQPDNTFIVHSLESDFLQGVFGPYASKPEVTLAIAEAIGGNCRFGIRY
jgi:hypothetical protein